MKLYFFGTCAGTAPLPGTHHTSFAVETGGGLYWFDAGECCGYTAHLMGVDLLKIRGIFISHTHMDHVGGLANLLWYIRKVSLVRHCATLESVIDVFIPEEETWEGIVKLLSRTEGGFGNKSFEPRGLPVTDGVLCDDGHIKVTAFHNNHLEHLDGEAWRSFCYRIEAQGRSVVFSGDVRDAGDTVPAIGGGCDILLMETGHHGVERVARDVRSISEAGHRVGELWYIHNGDEIRANPIRSSRTAREAFGGEVRVCLDATVADID